MIPLLNDSERSSVHITAGYGSVVRAPEDAMRHHHIDDKTVADDPIIKRRIGAASDEFRLSEEKKEFGRIVRAKSSPGDFLSHNTKDRDFLYTSPLKPLNVRFKRSDTIMAIAHESNKSTITSALTHAFPPDLYTVDEWCFQHTYELSVWGKIFISFENSHTRFFITFVF